MSEPNYGRLIAAERAKHRIKQYEVAKYAGISRNAMADIEIGRILIQEPTFHRILAAITLALNDKNAVKIIT